MDAQTQVVLLLLTTFILPCLMWCSPLFLPGPQSCHETGRTICAYVADYPEEQIYQLLMSARSQSFNLSSLFLDERTGDVEPNLAQISPSQEDIFPTTERWTNDRAPSQTPQPERWKQIIQTTYNRAPNRNNPQTSRTNGQSFRNSDRPLTDSGQQRPSVENDRRESRAQHLDGNIRRDWNNPNISPTGRNDPVKIDRTNIQERRPISRTSSHLPEGNPAYVNPSGFSQHGNRNFNNQRNPVDASRFKSNSPSKTRYNEPSDYVNQRKDIFQPMGTPVYDKDYQSKLRSSSAKDGYSSPPYDTYRQDEITDNRKYDNRDFGVTQNIRLRPTDINNIRYPMMNVSQVAIEPFEVQPPLLGVKGRSDVTRRSRMSGNWKGSPFEGAPSTLTSSLHTARRERSNIGGATAESACRVRSTFVPPRAALNDRSQWKFVVNLPERDPAFSQVIRVDLCLNEGESCSSRFSLPFGFESRCRQKYLKKRLLSLDADGRGTSEDNFFIPSCCVCQITRTIDKKKRK